MRIRIAASVVCLAFLSGCATAPYPVEEARQGAMLIPGGGAKVERPTAAGTPEDVQLSSALQNLRTLADQLTRMEKEKVELRQALGARQRGYFTSDETDRIESLLFRYLACRESLWDMIAYYGNCQEHFSGTEAQTKAFAIGFSAAVLAQYRSSGLVASVMDEGMLVDKLNEIHVRYGVPAGSYDSLFYAVTSPANIRALQDAHGFFADEAKTSDSTLARITASEGAYGDLVREGESLYEVAQKNVAYILKKKSLLLPGAANRVRHNALLAQARRMKKDISDNLYVAQGVLFNDVSDIKRPMTLPADFTPDQVRLIKSLLQPGDLLFTFTAGYMSNVFLPGRFKHGITYVGPAAERRSLDPAAAKLANVPGGKRVKLANDLKVEKLESGYDADVIEAVAEGVIFNSLDYLLKHHINRVAILRPLVSADERADGILNTFLMLGGQYDFNFDFSDASYTCCTEAIYRAWNKRGGIDFTLVRRLAVRTLSADDIIEYHLSREKPLFDVIVVAEEDPQSMTHHAKVVTGAAAAERLRDMFGARAPSSPPGASSASARESGK